MGGGASQPYDDEDDDKPIVHPGLPQIGGHDANQEAMAAAQWNRILKHTKQAIAQQQQDSSGSNHIATSDDAMSTSRPPKIKGSVGQMPVSSADEQMMKNLLNKDAAKKKAPNKLAALSTNFIEKEHLEATKTEKQREKDRKQAAAAEARKNYKNTLLYPEDEFVAGRVHNNVGGSNPVIGLGGVTNRSFISGLLSRAAGAMDGRGGRRRDYIEPPEDPNAPRDLEEEDFVPDVVLPPLLMQLKSRDHGSITFIYDVDIDAITVLNTIRQPKNKHKVREPLYQFEHRLAMSHQQQGQGQGGSGAGVGIGEGTSANASLANQQLLQQQQQAFLNRWCKSSSRVRGTQVTIEGLQPNVMYEFRGCRMQWDSDWGPVVCCRTGPGAPSIPRSIRATEVGSNSILLAWVLPDKDNGLPVTDYVVRYKEWIDPTKPKVDHSKNQSRDKQRHEEDEDAFYNTGGYGDDPGDGSAEEVYVDVDKYQNASELAAEAADRKWGTEVYRDKPRFFLMAGLKPSTVYMFKVCAVNLAGEGEFTHKVCVRTLVEGATDVTPWVMAIDQKTHQAFYMHPRTQAVTWTLPPGVLIDQPESFKNKKIYLNQVLRVRSVQACKEHKLKAYICKLQIERDAFLMQKSFDLLHKLQPWEIQAGPIRINYTGEEGIDAGGLAKDWFVEMSKRLVSIPRQQQTTTSHHKNRNKQESEEVQEEADGFDKDKENSSPVSFSIIYETEQGVTINPTAGVVYSDAECRYMYTSLGMFIAKALIDGQTIGIQFHKLILLCLLAAPVDEIAVADQFLDPVKRKVALREAKLKAKRFSLSDLQDTEPEFYRGMKWIAENSVDGAEISFSTTYQAYVYNARTQCAQPKQITVELVEGGDERIVTDADKDEYIQLMVDWLCHKRYEPYITYITEGLRTHLPYQFLQHFTVDELGAMIGGATTIDPKDIQHKVLFSVNGYDEDSQQVKWLWSILGDLSQSDLHKFLEFVTGCPSMPMDGLRPPLLLTMDTPENNTTDQKIIDQALPHSHTCFNQLVIPKYSSFRVMKMKFEFALENTGTGFYMS